MLFRICLTDSEIIRNLFTLSPIAYLHPKIQLFQSSQVFTRLVYRQDQHLLANNFLVVFFFFFFSKV